MATKFFSFDTLREAADCVSLAGAIRTRSARTTVIQELAKSKEVGE